MRLRGLISTIFLCAIGAWIVPAAAGPGTGSAAAPVAAPQPATPQPAAAKPAPAAAVPATAARPTLTPANAAAVKKAIAAPGAKAVLVNIWASWCGPCREEFPDVLKIRRDLGPQGVRVILVSADFDDARADAVKFLADMGVDFASFIKVGKDEEFIDGLAKEWTGTLPATLVYDGSGTLRDLREGKQSYETFRSMVEKALKDGSARPGS